jgi:hypothetical protein
MQKLKMAEVYDAQCPQMMHTYQYYFEQTSIKIVHFVDQLRQ